MNTQAIATHGDDGVHPGWLWAAGILQIMVGAAAIISPVAFSFAIEMFIGAMMLVSGIVTIVASFFNKSWGGFFASILTGILFAVGGAALLWSPILGVLTLTTFLGVIFLMQSIFAIVLAFQIRPEEGWGTMLASGLAALLLAILILAGLRSGASAGIIGVLFGVNMILAGFAFFSVARGQKA